MKAPSKQKPSRDETAAILHDGTAIDRAMLVAHRRVIERHRLLGIPLATWRDGQVVELDPNSVELPVVEPAE